MSQSACPSIFDYPISVRTDQYDRLAEVWTAFHSAAERVEDWTGIYVKTPALMLTSHFPVHDVPMGMACGKGDC